MKFSLTVLSTALLIPFSEGFDLQDNWNIEDVLATNTGKEFTFQYPGTKKDFLRSSFGTAYDAALLLDPFQTAVSKANPTNKVMNKVRATWYAGDTCKVVSDGSGTGLSSPPAGEEISQSYGTEGYGAAFIPWGGVELFSGRSLGWSTHTTLGEKKICIPEMYEYMGDSVWKQTHTESCDSSDPPFCQYTEIAVSESLVGFDDCPTLSDQKLGWSEFYTSTYTGTDADVCPPTLPPLAIGDVCSVNDQGFLGVNGSPAVIYNDDTLLELKFTTETAKMAKVDAMNFVLEPTARSNEMIFCVRIGLFTGNQEVSFLETVVTLTDTMGGDFSVEALGVAQKEKTSLSSSLKFELSTTGPSFDPTTEPSLSLDPSGEPSSGPRSNVCKNNASGTCSTISGGEDNEASGEGSFIGGGSNNKASGTSSTILGGQSNNAKGASSVVIGGSSNQAIGKFSIAMGKNAIAKENQSLVINLGKRKVKSTRIGEFLVNSNLFSVSSRSFTIRIGKEKATINKNNIGNFNNLLNNKSTRRLEQIEIQQAINKKLQEQVNKQHTRINGQDKQIDELHRMMTDFIAYQQQYKD